MMKKYIYLFLLCACAVLASCDAPDIYNGSGEEFHLQIDSAATALFKEKYSEHNDPYEDDYHTSLADLSNYRYGERMIASEGIVPVLEVKNPDILEFDVNWGLDVSDADLSKIDLSSFPDYNRLSFTTNTIWPGKSALPYGFDPKAFLDQNKNPGLGIRSLHDRGITGEGVGVAILDISLLLDHTEYKDQLMYYEVLHMNPNWEGDKLHGTAVSSIVAGKSVGVAPNAKLYFIGLSMGHYIGESPLFDDFEVDCSILADGVNRIIELNRRLPDSDKIRVISISSGYDSRGKGYQEMIDAVKRAESENIFVLDLSWNYYNFDVQPGGMTRDYNDDPNIFETYGPTNYYRPILFRNPHYFSKEYILVPQGARTLAWPTGEYDYRLDYTGGLSWTAPWLSGFYALCCQIKPGITPQEFIQVITDTGVMIDYRYKNQSYPFGRIINPEAVINELLNNL